MKLNGRIPPNFTTAIPRHETDGIIVAFCVSGKAFAVLNSVGQEITG